MFFVFCLVFAFSHDVIVVDGGSTGTRLYIYSYSNADDLSSFSVYRNKQGEQVLFKTNIPLHPALQDESVIEKVFTPLIFDGINNEIPASNRSSIPIFVLLSGGVRNLTQSQRNTLLDKIFNFMKQRTSYQIKKNHVRVVLGNEEGLFAWLSTNLALGKLKTDNTIATIEMGGSTINVATEISSSYSSKFNKYVYNIFDGSRTYNVFAHSWDNWGDRSAEFAIDQIIYDETGKTESPCYLNGSVQEIPLKDGIHNFTGASNYEKCQEYISKYYKKPESNKCDGLPAFFEDEGNCVPFPGGFEKVYGFGVYLYSLEYLNYSKFVDMDPYIARIHEYSHLNYSQAKALNKSYKYTKRAFVQANLCINFLERGTNGQISRIYRHGYSDPSHLVLDWTFGAALYFVSTIIIFGSPWWSYVLIVIACLCLVDVCIIIVIYVIRRKRPKRARLSDSTSLDDVAP